ncbi:MAG: hypothetical protein A2W93_08200 [Bacteroidetes bacterium GWF2_43_63]|nr:MAG: hypothetical protein A2W94_04855 [Bacteroidetes bacterium GWE2_42_42]OFY55593.1 MAG: hypothetical protein A2W93_08200 [Bacteroidetes bacterium GWF2_43_63]HBG71609.1 hypothetical protein [Bacteroidales bacterium]HCB62142.1 hypothetical protein [Bacteroidales bacterium]HCY22370.1 hypothetical protein [Bacteroidales bacterium]
MNKIIFPILCLFLVIPTHAQTSVQADVRLIDSFGEARVQTMTNQTPDSILYYNFFLNYSFEIWKAEDVMKYIKPANAGSVVLLEDNLAALSSREDFNILHTGLKWSKDQTQWFKIENANYYIKLHSLSYIERKFKADK